VAKLPLSRRTEVEPSAIARYYIINILKNPFSPIKIKNIKKINKTKIKNFLHLKNQKRSNIEFEK